MSLSGSVDQPTSNRAGSRSHRWSRLPGWMVVAGVVCLPAVMWLAAADLGMRFGGPTAVLHSLANLSALTGTAVFAVAVVLGARIRAVLRVLGGFDRMYRIHRGLGYTAPVLLASHAVLVVSSKAVTSLPAGLVLLTPDAGWNVFLGVIALVGLIGMVLVPVLRRMRHETFVLVHRLVGVTFLIGSLHLVLVPSTWALPPPLIAYLLGLILAGAAAFAYRSLLGRYLVRRYRYRIEEVNRLGSTAVELVLSPLERAVVWEAGQFAFLTIEDGLLPAEAHPFSITSTPDDPRLRFVVKALGDYTTRLLELGPGGVALIEGPFGDFRYDQVANRRQVWIACGIGVTPFLGCARTLADPRYAVDLYYCTERAEDAFVADTLFALADANPRLRVIPVRKVSLGRITVQDMQGVSGDLARQDFFICGPQVMVRNLSHQLLERGVPQGQIHFEDFGALSVGPAA